MTSNLIGLRAENYKRLGVVEVDFPETGGVVAIMGRNEAGKSSLLDALETTIAGRKAPKQTQPIKAGAEQARVVATFDDIVVTRVYRESGTTAITVTNREGLRYGRADELLQALYSHVALDPLAFSRLKDAEQVQTLLGLIGFDPSKLDAEHDAAYAERTGVNRDVKNLEARLNAIPEDKTVPSEPVSVAKLSADLEAALASDAQHARLVENVRQADISRSSTALQIEELEAQLQMARQALETDEANYERALAERDAFEVVDPEPIRAQINDAERINTAVAEQAERRRIAAEVAEQRANADKLTKRIEKAKADKADALAKADVPGGLSIDENVLMLNSLPFSQASTAVKIRTGFEIAMRLNPSLRLVVIRDASLIDDGNRQVIDELAKANGFLVLMELADESGEVGVVLEEGAVREVRS